MPGLKINTGLRHHHGEGLDSGQRERLSKARRVWRGFGPSELLFDRVFWNCAVCRTGLGNPESWPRNLHPCACGEWHPVCLGCFTARLATPGADLFNGLCEVCPDALAVAEAVMG